MKTFFRNNIIVLLLIIIFQSSYGDSLFYTFQKKKMNAKIVYIPISIDSCQIGLALSGGGARGAAHLGILKRMNEYGLPVSRMAGSSIGAVVGALILAGYTPEDILNILKNYEWNKLYNNKVDRTNIIVPLKKQNDNYFITLLLSEKGPFIPISLSYGQHLMEELVKRVFALTYYYQNSYEKLPIPFRIVATDLLSGEKIVLKQGPFARNLLASMSYPLLFAPIEMNGKMLIDGGIAENIPVEELKGKVNILFASDVTAGLRGKKYLKAPWQIADQVTTIMMKYNRNMLKDADFVFEPPVKRYSSTDFEQMPYFIQLGSKNFDMAIPNIRKMLEDKFHIRIYFEKLNVRTIRIIGKQKTIISKFDTIITLNNLMKHLHMFYGITPDSIVYELNTSDLNLYMSTDSLYETIRIYFGKQLVDVIQPLSREIVLKTFHSVYRNMSDYCRKFLSKKGYLTSLKTIQRKKNSVQIEFIPVKIEKYINVLAQNTRTRPYIIKREIVYPDSVLSHREALLMSIRHIFGLDLFRRVLLYYSKDRGISNHGRINVLYEEKPIGNLKFGVDANKNQKAEVGFGLINNNVAGHNLTFMINGLIGTRRRMIRFRFNTNRIGYTFTGLFINASSLWESRDLYSNHKNIGKFSYTRTEINIGLAKFLEKLGYTNISVYYRHEYGPADISLNVNHRYKSYGIRFESIVDKRDLFPIASRGIYSRILMESSTLWRGNSEIRYNKFEVDFRYFKKIWKYTTVNPFFSGGIMENQVPFLTWFTTTGTRRKLGWNIYEEYGKVYGLWGISVYQKIFPFVWGEKYLRFSIDWGNFWHDSESGFNWNEIKTGVGVGFILSTIVGPIEFSYEINENQNKFFWFSLGYNF